MTQTTWARDYVTEERIAFAVKLADRLAVENMHWTAFECAEQAVRKIFGRWMLDHTGSVPAPLIPLHYRLVDEVEQRLGLHRRRDWQPAPFDPAWAAGDSYLSQKQAAVA